MALFYFDINSRGAKQVDDKGIDFPDVDQARKEAVKGLLGIAQHEVRDLNACEFMVTVRDDTGMSKFTATLSLRIERTL